eukprot:Unigene5059_Nuclearia_a/m.15521 Unigene5059_Nuclearia_a/g.15521  ORF Unigene5059_Nuclearia_a/g.15521 Unigene5059_Nuclearia_a/m.15521 type:complete len:165 (-) Unigene5059_Nuclearia_a:107-601(-)
MAVDKGKALVVALIVNIALQLTFCVVQIGFAAYFRAVLPACLPIAMVVACIAGFAGIKYRLQWLLASFCIFSFLWFLFCLFLNLLYAGVLPWNAATLQVGFGEYITSFFISNNLQTAYVIYSSYIIYSLAGFLALVGAIIGPLVQNEYRLQDDILVVDQYGGFA